MEQYLGKRLYICMVLIFLFHGSLCVENITSERELLNYLLDPNRYDSSIRPGAESGNSTRIEVDLVMNSVGPVNDMDMEISASFYLRQQWVDQRLAQDMFNHTISVGYKHLDSLWIPDLFFPGAKSEKRHLMTTPNILIRLHPDGSILYSQRLSVTLQCFMELHKFPLDYQKCEIQMESYSYITEQVYFIWSLTRGSLNLLDNAFIPDFTITGVSSTDCTATYATGIKSSLNPTFPFSLSSSSTSSFSDTYAADEVYFIWSLSRTSLHVQDGTFLPDFSMSGITCSDCTTTYAIGSFTCLKAEVALKREIGFYITQTYIPSILIVILSWASFWIDHEAVPARISVGLLTVLTITTQSSGARSQLPRVPYIKSIDVWMAVCLVFVFGAYMEYAVVTVLSRKHRKSNERKNSESILNGVILKENGKPEDSKVKSEPGVNPGRTVDKRSRFVFPMSFLIFNLAYWIFYIHGPK